VKRALLVTVCGAVIVVGGLAGCSSNKSSTPSSSAPSTATATASATGSATASATAAAGATKVTIDGADQNVQGTVVCTNMGGNVQIAIGNATGGLGAQLSEGDSPTVKQVGLGNINGAALGYSAGVPGGEASATKDGSTYTITGKATGVDLSNPMQPVTKPFEIVVTCP
jgi:lipoprotein LpqH